MSIPVRALPTGRTSAVAFDVDTGAVHILDRSAVTILALCRKARPVLEHAKYLCEKYGVPDLSAATEIIDALMKAGLMVSPSDIVSRISKRTASAKATISNIGILTADRPLRLERCLNTYIDHVKSNQRALCFLVIDDSRHPANTRHNRLICEKAGQGKKHSVRYIGASEKNRLVRTLANSAIAEDILKIAISGGGSKDSMGASRNVLLLLSAGSALLMVDDDTICSPWVPSARRRGVVIGSDDWPTESMFFGTRDEAFASALNNTQPERDIVAAHEAFLGHSLADIVSSCEDEALDVSNCWRGLLSPVREWNVRVTMCGVAGDCGTFSPLDLLFSEGPTRERMVADEFVYRMAMTSREVMRCASKTFVSPDPNCMTMTIGLDNRSILPPFMPYWRNEDGIFGTTLALADNSALFAHLSCGILHDSGRPSEYVRDIWETAGRLRGSDLLRIVIGSMLGHIENERPADQICLLGDRLLQLSVLCEPAWSRYLNEHTTMFICEQLHRLDDILNSPEYPKRWLQDCERYRNKLLCTLRDSVAHVPVDCDESDMRLAFHRFGTILRGWPSLWARALGQRSSIGKSVLDI